jgi:hypothetical protein
VRGTFNRHWGEMVLYANEKSLAFCLLNIFTAGTIYASGGDTQNLTAVTFHNGSVHTLGTRKACPAEAYSSASNFRCWFC